jgi:hypothetical protein
MAREIPILNKDAAAAADLSAYQYHAVKLGASGYNVCSTLGDGGVIGILTNDPTSGETANVTILGITKAKLGGSVTVGDPLCTDASGHLITCSVNSYRVIAYALETGVSGDIRQVNVIPGGIVQTYFGGKVCKEDFSTLAATDLTANVQPDGTVADGSTGVLNHAYTPGGLVMSYAALGAGGTVTGPTCVAGGIDISGDGTNDEGMEIFTNWLGATGTPFSVGIDPAFYMMVKYQLDDNDGTDDLQIGFRSAEIVQAAYDDYNDSACFSICTAADPALIKLETMIGAAATTTTSTTQTVDFTARTHTVKVKVSAAGVVTYQHDATTEGTLATPTAVAAFTFTDGTRVIPFFRYLNAAGVTAVKIISWEVGYQ